ncbi:MAG: MATE family efflux transporter [Clostridia bacterium]|nr:MATE family efflux transporter [Clostridia bacterium]
MVRTTLDDLPMGRDEDLPEKGSKFKKMPLPEGVTHRMLYGDVVKIAWPSFLELVLTQLTSMADQIMVGQLPGEMGVQALSAVGISAQPKFLLMTMMQALNVGATAMVARFRGQGNREKANQVFRQSLLFNLVLSVLFMVVGVIFAAPLLHFMGGDGISSATYAFAKDYFVIQMYGFVPLCLTFTFTAVLRGIGDTKMPLIYNTLANAVNLVFNYFLIYGKCGFPEMDVAGASLATIIGQTAAFVFAVIIVLNKKRYVYLSLREKFRIDWMILANVVSIGIPSMVEQLFMRAGIIIYTRTVAGLGDVAYATHQICMNIQAMSFMTGQAFANSATTLMGQSLGKKRIDMAENYTRHTRRIGLYTSIVLGLLLIVCGRSVVWLYNQTPEVVSLGGSILIMVGCIQPFQSSQFIVAGALRGAGDTRFPAVVMFITVLVVRSSLALLLVNVFSLGLWGAWYALVADQLLRTALIAWHYGKGKWRFIKLKGENA